MKKEIERKFLVRNDKFKDQSVQKQNYSLRLILIKTQQNL